MKSIDYESLNPGIRKLVRMLRENGVETTDSGDGVTNVAAGMEGALSFPHVHCVCTEGEHQFLEEVGYVATLLSVAGVKVADGMVQGTVDAMSDVRTISVLGVTDDMLQHDVEP